MPIGPPHAPGLMQQIELIRVEVGKLPITEIVSDMLYPNATQQKALLKRAMDDLTHAIWAIEEYNGGRQLGAMQHPKRTV
jgi:hypothetical protein